MTDAQQQKKGRPDSQPASVGLPRSLTGGSDTPAVTGKAPESGKPTPVRDLSRPAASTDLPAEVDVDVEETTVDVDGLSWTVRVQGRSGGASTANTPLLLVGFWKAPSVASTPDREALVVGRLLADMSEEELAAALAGSRNPPDPDRRPGFFAEISERRRS